MNSSHSRGRFITMEGVEGVGKTTNMEFIAEYLQASGKPLIVTREPGGTHLGEEIRALLLGHRDEGMDSSTELLLMFAARAEHLQQVIIPAIEKGDWVLCDRFTDATYAYQGGGRGIDLQRIEVIENWVQGDLRPDLIILLDLPVDIGLQRAGDRSEPDRFETEHRDFFEKVRNVYMNMADAHPQRYRVIDASKSLEEVQRQIRQVLDDYLEECSS